MKKYTLLGVEFQAMTKTDAIRQLRSLCKKRERAAVFTPNSIILTKAAKDKRLITLLNSADMLLPDGAGLSLACRLCGLPRGERIAGIDAAYELLGFAEKNGLSVYLLGGNPGVARTAARNLKRQMPSLNICGTHHGYFKKTASSEENKKVLWHIRRAAPDILFVCFGFPAQEAWILKNRSKLPSVRLFMGLGGSLDVWSGNIRRAPVILQRMGLEWLWRCILEPRRFRDVAALPLFLILCKSSASVREVLFS